MSDIQDPVMQVEGIGPDRIPDRQLEGIQEMIRRERRRFATAKVLTGFFWMASLVMLGSYMLAVKWRYTQMLNKMSAPSNSEIVGVIMILETILPLTIVLATVCSVFLYIRAKSVNLLQVHERLHNLEEMVKVLLAKQC